MDNNSGDGRDERTSSPDRKKRRVQCANVKCHVKTTHHVEAPSFARLYLEMYTPSTSSSSISPSNVPMICYACNRKAKESHQVSKDVVRTRGNLFELNFALQSSSKEGVVDLDGSDDDVSPDSSDDETEPQSQTGSDTYKVSVQKLDEVIQQTLTKFNFRKQVVDCVTVVEAQTGCLATDFGKMDGDIRVLEHKINDALRTYNDNLAFKCTEHVEIGSLDIDKDGILTLKKSEKLGEIAHGLHRKMDIENLNKEVQNFESFGGEPLEQNQELLRANQCPSSSFTTSQGESIFKRLIFKKPEEGQTMFGTQKNSLDYWRVCKIINVSKRSSGLGLGDKTVYKVEFNKEGEDAENTTEELTGKQIAFMKPTTIVIPVGHRVIAKFKQLVVNDDDGDGKFYVGIVAEIPKKINKSRYLIFFDDGYAQYSNYSDVLPVVETEAEVWHDVHQGSREFIMRYLNSFPDRSLLRAGVGTTISLERNGKWIPARVVEIDGVLFKVQYNWDKDKLMEKNVAVTVAEGLVQEWIYRGSSRLAQLCAKMREDKQPIFTAAIA